MKNTSNTNESAAALAQPTESSRKGVLSKLSLTRIDALYAVLVCVVMLSPAYAQANAIAGPILKLLGILKAAGAGVIGLSCCKWALDFFQGGGGSREALTNLGIGSGLFLAAEAIGTFIAT